MPKEKLLFLGPETCPLIHWLKDQGHTIFSTVEKITPEYVDDHNFYFLISYGYRYILKQEILSRFPNRAINLHISYLPWNRGADPNFWSFLDGTPKGVTIHYLDQGIDTGDIIAQQQIEFDTIQETLATSYQKLQTTIQQLFKHHWHEILNLSCTRQPQTVVGTTHRSQDKIELEYLLTDGWDTPVTILEQYRSTVL